MESEEGVSLPLIHKHLMASRKTHWTGDCCGLEEPNEEGYYCKECDFLVHKKCCESSEYINLPSIHKHFLIPWKDKRKGDCCGRIEAIKEGYYCRTCSHFIHKKCSESSEYINLPFIHKHLLIPGNDMRRGDCCGRFEVITNGYYCKSCDFFVHKKCGDEATKSIKHPSHPLHRIRIEDINNNLQDCDLCGKRIVGLSYNCYKCNFYIDLRCAKYPPPAVMDIFEKHHHKLTLLKNRAECEASCGKRSDHEFSYKCHECNVCFHCVPNKSGVVERPLEVNHSSHSLHPLKLLTGKPAEYSDGTCRLCGRKVDKQFYHCSSCNFTLDMRCVLHSPPQSLLDLKVHDHQLTLLPRLDSFTCNACGLKGDRSPYVCFECGFIIHQDCLGLPRVININRHDHRVSRTSVLGVVNSVCRVCREKVDWTCGGYSCQRCPGYVVHSKCATRNDVWNGKELEGVPEEIEDLKPYVVIDGNTIQHFSHRVYGKNKEHYLRLNVDGILGDENKRCNACNYPICLQFFYGCIDCDFVLHQDCAELPKKKWHVLDNQKLTLVTRHSGFFVCDGCCRPSNCFVYHGDVTLDVRCGSISEPFVHPSHPHHPLYYIPRNQDEICNGCNKKEYRVLRCIEDGCEFVLGFNCATLPHVVKHRVDDHPLSLCYGEEGAIGKHWCDICEKESDPRKWFYTCKDHQASLHTECVLGDFTGFRPESTIKYFATMAYHKIPCLNDSVTRPLCSGCKSRCIYPIFLKLDGPPNYYCSYKCVFRK